MATFWDSTRGSRLDGAVLGLRLSRERDRNSFKYDQCCINFLEADVDLTYINSEFGMRSFKHSYNNNSQSNAPKQTKQSCQYNTFEKTVSVAYLSIPSQ